MPFVINKIKENDLNTKVIYYYSFFFHFTYSPKTFFYYSKIECANIIIKIIKNFSNDLIEFKEIISVFKNEVVYFLSISYIILQDYEIRRFSQK